MWAVFHTLLDAQFNERITNGKMYEHERPEWRPLDSIRSARDIGRQVLNRLLLTFEDALDCFGEDSPEDQAITSERWNG